MKQYLGENPFRYTYQVAPNRLLILEEVPNGTQPHTSLRGTDQGDFILLREDYPFEWKGQSKQPIYESI
jgi:hypothetical protein